MDRRHRSFFGLLAATLSGGAALVVALTVWFTLAERQQILDEARGQTATLARALEEHIARAVGTARLLMLDTGDEIGARGGLQRIGRDAMHRMLVKHVNRVTEVTALYVYDDALQLYATSSRRDPPRMDGAQYRFVAVHREQRIEDISIGDTRPGPFTGAYNIPITRRLERNDGTLRGVLGSALSMSYFERFYRALALPPDAALALLRDDGVLLLRFPVERFVPGQNWRGTALFDAVRPGPGPETVELQLPGDDETRLVAFRRFSELPLAVAVSRDPRVLLDGWWRAVRYRATLLFGALLLLALLGYALLREAGKRREAETRYRATFEQAAVGIAHVAPDGRWLRVNRRLCEITGYPRDALQRLTFRDLTHPDDYDPDQAMLARLLAGEVESCSSEKRYLRRDGALMWVNLTRSVVRHETGRPEYIVAVVEDIDARKAADTLLKEGRARLDEAQHLAALGSWELDLRTNRLVWSDEIYRLFEIEPAGFAASYEAFLGAVHPDDRTRVDAAYRDSVASRRPYEITHRLRMSDGRIKFVLERGRTDYGQGGAPLRSLGTVQDVTERVQRERAMALKDAAIESSINAIAMAGLDGCLTYVNPAFLHLWGYARVADVLGRPALDLWERPDEAQRVIDALAAEGRWFGELEARRAGGERRLLQVSAHRVGDEYGAPSGMMASFVDISQRAAAERELERLNATLEGRVAERTRELAAERNFIATVLDTVGALVVVLDPQGRVVGFNRACQVLTGYTLEEMRGSVFWERLIPPEQREGVKREFAALAGTQRPSTYENDWLTRDGERRGIAWANAAIVGNDGRVEHVIGTGIDVTERRRAEREMQEARDAAQHANAAKSAFLSRMSHELRSPLHAILGFAQVMALEGKRLTAGQHGTLERIQRAGWHLLALINDVLDLSTIESGSQPVTLEPLELSGVIRECADMTRALAEAASVEIEIESSARERRHVMADATRLKQVLANLLSNAVKYNRARGVVRIRVAGEGEGVALQVADTGIGMDEEQLGSLFEPFNRLGAESLGVEGTGIGLVICKRLVEAMGGTIAVASQPGRGSTFTVSLRVADAPAQSALRQRGQERRRTPRKAGLWTVLYVEDDAAGAEVMRRVFARRGDLRLVVARDGAEALELARRYRPGFAILDMNLPGMDGHELLRRLRGMEETRDIPALALSANAFETDVAQARGEGFTDYLTKPLRVEEFLERLDELLRPAKRPG